MMKVDKAGLDFLHDREGCKLVAYLDTGGVPTIGMGSIRMFGKPVTMGMTCTMEQACTQTQLDLVWVEATIEKNIRVPLNQNQYNALVSFIYNIGAEAFVKSTMLRKLNQGDYVGAAGEFKRWNKDNGKEVDGLTNRRKLEANLFSK